MLTTLLFDLDGTLVGMRKGGVELAFLWHAIRRFWGVVPPWRLRSWFFRAAERMQRHGTARPNLDVFVEELAALAGRPPARVAERLHALVDEDFPRLRRRFFPIPGARECLLRARALGYRLAIATNPIFPLAAIRQRMEWGEVADIPFELVTSAELMTRCKPDPAYYVEVLARLGARPEECLMIGNDARKDLTAKRIGVRTYFLTHPWSIAPEEVSLDPELVPDRRGAFGDLAAWLEAERAAPSPCAPDTTART